MRTLFFFFLLFLLGFFLYFFFCLYRNFVWVFFLFIKVAFFLIFIFFSSKVLFFLALIIENIFKLSLLHKKAARKKNQLLMKKNKFQSHDGRKKKRKEIKPMIFNSGSTLSGFLHDSLLEAILLCTCFCRLHFTHTFGVWESNASKIKKKTLTGC